jgi:Asp-tRNA(Asn)/Glu-tRNA(Gln) amidotransferase A subunit family amidase
MRLDQARSRAVAGADLNAFISLSAEEGDGDAVAVKDVIDVRGMYTTCGSGLRPAVAASLDAEVIRTREVPATASSARPTSPSGRSA